MAEKAIEDIKEDFLTCSICLNRFNVPKMLPCIHSFCQECLEKHVTKPQGGKLTCPICRVIFDLPESGVKGMKTNFHLESLGERMDLYERLKSTDAVSQKCQSCKIGVVSAFCFDCGFAICSNCQSQHSWFPPLRSHTITSVGDINQSEFNQSWQNTRPPFCEEHRSEKLHFYCTTCSKLICRDCTIVQHPKPDHVYIEAKTQFEELAAAVTACLDKSEVQLQVTKQYILDRKAGSSEVGRSTSAMIKKIRQHYDEMTSSLEKQLEEACEKVAKDGKSKEARFQHLIDQATNWVERMENAQEVSKKITKENNPWELLLMSNDLIGAFKALECDKDDLKWYDGDLQNQVTFQPEEALNITLGNCCTESDIPVVLRDIEGDLTLCYFNHDSRKCNIKSLTKDNNYDMSTAQEVFDFTWEKEYCPYSKLVASWCDNSKIILGLGVWLAILDVRSKSIKAYLLLDKNRNAVIENIDFDVKSGKLFFTTRGNRKVIKGVNLIEIVNDDTYSKICEIEQFHGTTNNDVGHEIKMLLFYSTSYIVILTVGGQLVKYNLDSRQSTESNCGIASDLKVLAIFKAESKIRQVAEQIPHPSRGHGMFTGTFTQRISTIVTNRHYRLSKNLNDKIDPQYRIDLFDENTLLQTWNITSNVALPLMCFQDKSSDKPKIFNWLGVISL